ncbi:MAG: Crp/Fnr family transcriptional regulator [Rhodocyclaceae bacterium]|nr:Crp/Fnr family transcriptional regulator [Rhodocyclaceae bacterium]
MSKRRAQLSPTFEKTQKIKSAPVPKPSPITLRTVSVLSEFDHDELARLAEVAVWRKCAPDEIIARQNESSDQVFFVVSGFVKILRGGDLGFHAPPKSDSERRIRMRQQVMVALLGPGDIVGEIGTLLDRGRSASIVALTHCEVVSIPGVYFMGELLAFPPFALAVVRKMAQRLVDADRQVELMRGELDDRIRALRRECLAKGLDVEQWLTQTEIARMVGASRSARTCV